MNLSDVSKSRAPLTAVGLLMNVAAYLGVHSRVAGHPWL